MLADTLERLEFPATLPESLETQRDERAQADAITERIKASDEFQKLTPKQGPVAVPAEVASRSALSASSENVRIAIACWIMASLWRSAAAA